MILHTLNAEPSQAAFSDCLGLLETAPGTGEALLLLGDGVYAGIAGTVPAARLLATGVALYALGPDVRAAGLAGTLEAAIECIDYAGFVALTERYPLCQAWY